MNYLLDTCVLSDFVRGDPGVVSTLKSKPPSEIAISSVSWMEIRYGLALNPQRAKRIEPVLNAFAGSVSLLPYERDDASVTAECRVRLRRLGTPIGPYDLMIAGCAINRGLILVTSNTAEFERLGELQLEDWRG